MIMCNSNTIIVIPHQEVGMLGLSRDLERMALFDLTNTASFQQKDHLQKKIREIFIFLTLK